MVDADRRWPRQAAAAAAIDRGSDAGERSRPARRSTRPTASPATAPTCKGGIGPNLLDTIWIHGGKPEEILHTITVGVPEKGMLTWGPILGPEKVAQVAAYVVEQESRGDRRTRMMIRRKRERKDERRSVLIGAD